MAGVTLLALGNGAPDIFSAFAAVNQDEDKKASLAVGALFGRLKGCGHVSCGVEGVWSCKLWS